MSRPEKTTPMRGPVRLTVSMLCAAGILAVVWFAANASEGAQGSGEMPVCSECHACAQPSRTNPCLRPGSCPRHQAMTGLDASLGPDVVILDELENLYVPVRFDHRAHAKMVGLSGGCGTCHHLTPPNAEHPACSECHPGEIPHEDLSQPGLKGAYHRNCMSCHKEWDTDTACEICHARKEEGVASQVSEGAFHSSYETIEMNELIVFSTGNEEGYQVPFHHRNHATLYGIECSDCHIKQGCGKCHVHGGESHPMGALDEVDLHDTCFKCHTEEPCGKCHGNDPEGVFKHKSTGWPLKSYHANLACKNCHGEGRATTRLDARCEGCHRGGWPADFKHAVTGVELDELHTEFDCTDCHTEGYGKRPDCSACHDDSRSYDRKTGFGN